jgi:hypothetical protein
VCHRWFVDADDPTAANSSADRGGDVEWTQR